MNTKALNKTLQKLGKTATEIGTEVGKIAVPFITLGVLHKLFPSIPISFGTSDFSDSFTTGFELDPDECTYSTAIKAISKSTMSSYDRQLAITEVAQNGAGEYYSAVASIANSTMSSYDRVLTIKRLNVVEEA